MKNRLHDQKEASFDLFQYLNDCVRAHDELEYRNWKQQ